MPKVLKLFLIGFAVLVLATCSGTLYLISRMWPGYEVTNNRVYFRSFNNLNWKIERREVQKADPKTIRSVRSSGGLYAKDKECVFVEGSRIGNADPESFRVLDWRQKYSRDKSFVYWHSVQMSDDPDHLEILGAGYARDRKQVYYNSSIVEGADVNSFSVTSITMGRAEDKDRKYNLGRPMD